MSSRHFFEGIITKENNSLLAHLIRGILTPLSWIYELAHIIYFIPYKLKIRKKYKAYIPVISVGNITMGGTGKTPFVCTLTNIIKDMGLKPVIISRGYGRKSKKPYILMPGTQVSTDITGDEPQTLSKALNIPIIIGKNRCVSVELSKELNPDIIILDDGMQYWQLEKDIEIVVANAHKPLGGGTTLPAGDLRENKNALKRAQFIILNNSINLNKKEQEESIAKIKSITPNSSIFIGTIRPTSISFNNKNFDISTIENKNVTVFSGIANPNRFTETLKTNKSKHFKVYRIYRPPQLHHNRY